MRFGDKSWLEHLRKIAQDYKFQATLKPRLDRTIQDWHDAQPSAPPPVVVDHAPDPSLQTGESRLLGGAMSIHAPWSDGSNINPPG